MPIVRRLPQVQQAIRGCRLPQVPLTGSRVINYQYIHNELVKIKWLLEKQSEFFGNVNPDINTRFDDLLHNVKTKQSK